jgi:flagellin
MSLKIQHNIAAMNAHRNLSVNDSNMAKSLEKLSSGFRINRAADDAAGLAISEQMRADIASLNMGSRNVTEANSLLQIAEGAMSQISDMLVRLKELATQAASANASSNLSKIDAEADQLYSEIDRIANSTEYAGTKLLNGTFGVSVAGASTLTTTLGRGAVSGLQASTTYTFATVAGASNFDVTVTATLSGVKISQTVFDIATPTAGSTTTVKFDGLGLSVTFNENFGATADGTIVGTAATAAEFQVGNKNTINDRIGITLTSITASVLGLGGSINLTTAASAQAFLTTLDTAMSNLNNQRGNIGAAQNRLSYAAATLATTIENTSAAESSIRDVDMASEMTNFTKNQILVQAGTAMLAQANSSPNLVLSLFQ